MEVVMKFDEKDPPRQFEVGNSVKFMMNDCGSVHLYADEQVTFHTESGAEFDVARKDWGFYATPSLNGRFPQFNLRAVLIRNRGTGRYFVLVVELGHEDSFWRYMEIENLEIVAWLDSTEACDRVRNAMSRMPGSDIDG